jgi:uncharacterized protein (TIGR03382 family)
MSRFSSAALGAVLALVALFSTASAGPIRWHYSGAVEATNGGPFAHFGAEDKHWFDPTTGTEGVTPHQILGRIDATFSGSGTGNEVIHAAAFDSTCLEAFPIDDAWALNRPNRFLVKVTILDEASGQTADLEYTASGTSNGFFLSGTGVVELDLESRIDVLRLGGNQYTVEARVRGSETAAHIEFDIAATHHNPEPGTLALAVMGLAGLVTRRLRYRLGS